jgi:hypothetical protein
VNAKADEPEQSSPDGMAAAVRKQQERRKQWLNEGEPSAARFVGQIGVLHTDLDRPLHRTMARSQVRDGHFLERSIVAHRCGDRILVRLAMDA